MDNRFMFPQYGIITAVDKAKNLAKIYIPIFKIETDFVKLSSIPIVQWKAKDEVVIVFINGDVNLGVVIAKLHNENSTKHPDDLFGDFIFRHEDGAKMHLKSSGLTVDSNCVFSGGTKGAARVDDSVEVDINLSCSCGGTVAGKANGTIKSGSSKVKVG